MAIDDLEYLNQELPEIFKKGILPSNWEEEWIIVPIDSPEREVPPEITPSEDTIGPPLTLEDLKIGDNRNNKAWIPSFKDDFPSHPRITWEKGFFPPPDALAFYLPYHFFYPIWWGIYLTFEGVNIFANYIFEKTSNGISIEDAVLASQVFLYGHEAYHHNVESFATRLEITHRVPLYKTSFLDVYSQSMEDPDKCTEFYDPGEEALANAYGFLKVHNVFSKDKSKQKNINSAVESYIEGCSPCYRQALYYLKKNKFRIGECNFAELNQIASFQNQKDEKIWLAFPHAFSGITRISSKVNYIIHRDSPIVQRHNLHLRFIRYPDLKKKLEKLAKCIYVRPGKGSHEIWKSPIGNKFEVPRHPGDLKKGTLRNIIKQAGLNMSISEFLQAKV